jgi:VCBS repeat-containing protein
MKKTLTLLNLFFLFSAITFSQTNVSGIISSDTTWDLANSPYTVTGNVLVATGVTLTIEAGVTVKVSSSVVIQINGALIAIGTSSGKITFTSNEPIMNSGDWKYLDFSDTSVDATYDSNGNYISGSTLQYVDVLFGGSDSSKGVINITNSAVYLKNITLNNSASYGIFFSKSSGGTVSESKVISSIISDNANTGILCDCYQYNMSLTVESTSINSNIGYGISTGGGDAGGSHVFNYKNNIINNNNNGGILANANGIQNISGNLIYNNNGNGVRSRGNGTYTIEKNIIVGNKSVGIHGIYATHVIDNNVIANNLGGIEISEGGSYTVSDNQIVFNNNSGDGSGFDPYGGTSQKAWSSPVSLLRNTFFSNTSINSTILSFQPDNGDPSFILNNNNIHKNISSYEFKNYRNSSTSNVDAKNNYWGTSIESEIQSKIFDWIDDGSYGIINYTPFLISPDITAPISPPSNVIKTVSGSDVVLSWSANEESDIAGYKLYYGDPSGYSYSTVIDLGNVTTYTVTGGDIATEYSITAYDSSLDGIDDIVDGNESWYAIAKELKVTLSSSSSSISEPNSSATLTATLDNPSASNVTVNLSYSGTAAYGIDYSGASSVVISAGSLTGTIDITAIDDNDLEDTETIIIDVNPAIGGNEDGSQQTTINLKDDEKPAVSVTTSTNTIAENESVTITATLDAPSSQDVIINFDLSGTAINDLDYTTAFLGKGNVTTVAGNGGAFPSNELGGPYFIFIDSFGNIYIADRQNNRIQKWAPGATSGSTVAGGNGSGSANNQLNNPDGVFVDLSGNIYIADTDNNRIQKWAPGATEGITVAGGNGKGPNANQLNAIWDVYVDALDNIYIPDTNNHRIQKWEAGATEGTTIAGGNGQGSASNQFSAPYGLYVDLSGNIYVSDLYNHRIQKWEPGATEGTTVAGGNGQGSASNQLNNPADVFVDSSGNIYITDMQNHRIQKWAPGATSGSTVAGGNGSGSAMNQFAAPAGIDFDALGNMYISDLFNKRIQKFNYAIQILIPAGQTSGTLTMTGIQDALDENDEIIVLIPNSTNAVLSNATPISITITDLTEPPTVSFTLSGQSIVENSSTDITLTATLSSVSAKDIDIEFIMEGTATETVEYVLSSNTISIPAGSLSGTLTLSTNGLDDTLVEVSESIIFRVNTITNATAENDTISLNLISDDDPGVSISANETTIAEFGGVSTITATLDAPTSQDVIINFSLEGTAVENSDYLVGFLGKGIPIIIAGGNGEGSEANQLNFPSNIFVDATGNMYVNDRMNYRIQKWAPGEISGTIVAGGNGQGFNTNQLSAPGGFFVDSAGDIYVADEYNYRIMKWTPGATEGVIVAGGNGQGSNANQLRSPRTLFVDSAGNIYINDEGNHRIQKWEPGGTIGITVAGGNGAGSNPNQLNNPQSFFVDSIGNIYVSDYNNHRIQKWTVGATSGVTVAGGNSEGSAANQLNRPSDLHFDTLGNLFIADSNNHRIMKWTPGATEGVIVAGGNGQGSNTNQLNYPYNFYIDIGGNILYIHDSSNYRIQKWILGETTGITVSGGSGMGSNIDQLGGQTHFFVDINENIYISDQNSSKVVKYQYSAQIIIPAGQTTNTLSITGIEDDLNEEHETVILTPNPTNAFLTSASSVIITILDNNYAPVAIPDDIQVDEGATVTTLSNAETSLLKNDTDAEGDTLTAVLVSNPSNGSLTLNADGTFSYTHDGSETIEDSFTYKANDGLLDSEAATVNIKINPVNNNEPTDITLSNSTIEENVNNQSIGVFSAVDLDSSSSYVFSLVAGTGDTDNSDFEIINENELSNITEFDYEAKNQYSIRIKALDADGFSFEKAFNIDVTNLNDILIEGVTENTYCNDANATGIIDITVTQTNGTVTYLWTGPNQFSSTQEDVSNLPEGTYSVTVTDADFSKTQDFIVETTPIFEDLTVCYVTSDATDYTKNRVHLSYSNIYNASKYQILREGSNTGQYNVIGEVGPTETTYLDDTSNNNSSSYNYKVRLLDNCGNLSNESSAHKTILLQSSIAVDNTVNLSWSQYVGVNYSTYYVYRSIDGGAFEELVPLASTNQTFNDTSANVNEHSYVYYVSIIVNNCETTTQAKGVSTKNEVEIRSNQISLNLSSNNDSDGDGVLDINDKCPSSTPGTTVDANGCLFLPLNNFNIEVTSETCPDKNNGKLVITASETHSYIAIINNQSYNFTNNSLNISDLAPGVYSVCISVVGETFEQCYRITIDEGITITGKSSSVKSNKVAVEIEKGTPPFNVSVNGIEAFETISPIFNVDVKNGDSIEVKTAVDCEGVFTKKINFYEGVFAFPNPTSKTFEIALNQSLKDVEIEMFTPYAQLISAKSYSVVNGKVLLDITDMPSGMYFVKVHLETPVLLKIIKK